MLNKDRKLQLVISYIFSCLDSCNILYYGLSKKLLIKLQVLLNDCVCSAYAKCRFCWRESESVTKLAMELHILPVCFCILCKISLTIFKCIHSNAPDYLKDLIMLSQPQTGLHTSNCANRLVPLPFPKYAKFQMPSDILLLQYGIMYHLLSDLLLLCQTLSLPSKPIILILLLRMCD